MPILASFDFGSPDRLIGGLIVAAGKEKGRILCRSGLIGRKSRFRIADLFY